jgi:hypothetical protein
MKPAIPAHPGRAQRPAILLACAVLLAPVIARSEAVTTPSAPGKAATAGAASRGASLHKPAPHRSLRLGPAAMSHLQGMWGLDLVRVTRVASGNLLRFTFRVSDPERAAPLADRKATPTLYAERAHALLSVPVMDKIGPLRQAGTLKRGQEYWVAFSNKGNLVKTGDKVDVSIGVFSAEGLIVE